MRKEYTDQTLMPFGKHKGTQMVNVPADYLIYLYETGISDGPVRRYIEQRLDKLMATVQKRQDYINHFRPSRGKVWKKNTEEHL